MTISSRAIGLLCAVLVVALFASFTLISRLGLTSSLTLADIAAFRFGIGGALLAPVLWRHGFSGLRWREAVPLAFLGGLGFALLAYGGFWLAPASHGAVLLHGTLPLFTFAILTTIERRRPAWQRAGGISLIAAGVALMAWDSLSALNPTQLIGDALLLLAALCWSAYAIMARRLNLAAVRASAIVAGLSMCAYVPAYLLIADKALWTASARDLALQAVFQGVLIGVVSIFVYTRAVEALGAARTSLFTAAVPCATTVAAMPLLSEYPSVSAATGVAAVTAGMVIALRQADQ